MPAQLFGTGRPEKQPESGETRITWSEFTWTKIIDGERNQVWGQIPNVGPNTTLPDCPLGNHVVVDAHYKPRGPKYATLTIVCATAPSAFYEEIDVGMIQRKIEYNPRYRGQISIDQLWAIEATINASDQSQFNFFLGLVTDSLAQELLDKRMNGIDSYLEPAPIARRTTFFAWIIGVGGLLGFKQTPAFTRVAIPSGYEWLKTADRAILRPGAIERVEEWTGAKAWDDDLY